MTAAADIAQRLADAVDIELELAAAATFARDPRVAAAVDALNLRIDADGWGLAFVEMSGTSYQPSEAGEPAFIFAAEHGGELVDLVACRLRDRVCATRLGLAPALGRDWIDLAVERRWRLLLYANPLAWAHGGFHGAVLLDWLQARSLLADAPDIACADHALARRVHAALTVPAQLPRLSYGRAA